MTEPGFQPVYVSEKGMRNAESLRKLIILNVYLNDQKITEQLLIHNQYYTIIITQSYISR